MQMATQSQLIPFSQLTFWKQPIVAEDEIKVCVVLANKYKVKAKNFVLASFYGS